MSVFWYFPLGCWRSRSGNCDLTGGIRGALCDPYQRHFPILQVERRHFKLEKSEVRTMLSGGLSMGMMSSLVNLGTLALQTSINRLGRDIIVAHTAARKITEMFMIMFGVFGQTMAIFCGQNAGAGRMDRVRHGIGLAVCIPVSGP